MNFLLTVIIPILSFLLGVVIKIIIDFVYIIIKERILLLKQGYTLRIPDKYDDLSITSIKVAERVEIQIVFNIENRSNKRKSYHNPALLYKRKNRVLQEIKMNKDLIVVDPNNSITNESNFILDNFSKDLFESDSIYFKYFVTMEKIKIIKISQTDFQGLTYYNYKAPIPIIEM